MVSPTLSHTTHLLLLQGHISTHNWQQFVPTLLLVLTTVVYIPLTMTDIVQQVGRVPAWIPAVPKHGPAVFGCFLQHQLCLMSSVFKPLYGVCHHTPLPQARAQQRVRRGERERRATRREEGLEDDGEGA
jgi:hypothetical protein